MYEDLNIVYTVLQVFGCVYHFRVNFRLLQFLRTEIQIYFALQIS